MDSQFLVYAKDVNALALVTENSPRKLVWLMDYDFVMGWLFAVWKFGGSWGTIMGLLGESRSQFQLNR